MKISHSQIINSKIIYLSIAIIALAVFFFVYHPLVASAQTDEEVKKAIEDVERLPWVNKEFMEINQILYYSNACADLTGATSDVTLLGSTNLEKIYNFFLGKGLSDVQAAAVVGNIAQESGGDPELVQGGGTTRDPSGLTCGSGVGCGRAWGLIQWDGGARALDYQQQAGLSGNIWELGTQLDIIWWHMENLSPTGASNMLEGFKGITDLYTAVDYFQVKIEGAGTPVMDARMKAAELALESYAKNPSTSGNTSTQTECVCTTSSSSSSSVDTSLSEGSGDGSSSDGSSGGRLASLDPNTKPFAVAVANIVNQQFGVSTIYGWRQDAYPEHPSGLALDIMVGTDKALGDSIFDYFKLNAEKFKVFDIIWYQTYYEFAADGSLSYSNGMEDRGSITQNHMDHVHVWMKYANGDEAAPDGLIDPLYCEGDTVEGNPSETKENLDKKDGGDAGAGEAMRESNTDNNYPTDTTAELDYLENSGLYREVYITSTLDLKNGDIFISRDSDGTGGHIWTGGGQSININQYRFFRFITVRNEGMRGS